MKNFNIYTAPSIQPIAIQAGWSWFAFVAWIIWSCYYRVWLPAIFAVVAYISVLVVIESVPSATDTAAALLPVMIIAVPVWFGLHGNEWRGRRLIRRGYEHAGAVSAISSDVALIVWRTEASESDDSPAGES